MFFFSKFFFVPDFRLSVECPPAPAAAPPPPAKELIRPMGAPPFDELSLVLCDIIFAPSTKNENL